MEITGFCAWQNKLEVSKITDSLKTSFHEVHKIHNWAKWPECESDNKQFSDVVLMSGDIVECAGAFKWPQHSAVVREYIEELSGFSALVG
jgi:hypothetical protein